MFGQPGFLVMKSAMAEKLCFVPWRDISIQISIFAGSPSLRVDAARWALIQFPLVADLTADENVVASVWERGWDTVAQAAAAARNGKYRRVYADLSYRTHAAIPPTAPASKVAAVAVKPPLTSASGF